jgi:hypothetical protein
VAAVITLATLAQATEQQVFDQVARHLLTQKEKSSDIDNDRGSLGCLYRYDNGTRVLKCAGGCLISDEEFRQSFNSLRNGIGWQSLIAVDIAPREHCDLIYKLQDIHDCEQPKNWRGDLIRLAMQRRLDFDVCQEDYSGGTS